MKRVRILLNVLLCGLLLSSCSDDDNSGNRLPGEEPNTVKVRLKLAALPLNGSDADTRATMDKNKDELAIHNAYVLQFNGEADGSTLAATPKKLVADADNNVDCELVNNTSTNVFYVVANADASTLSRLATGTTLKTFRSLVQTQAVLSEEGMKTYGLLMCSDPQTFVPSTDLPPVFVLRSRMAKVSLGFTIADGLSAILVSACLQHVPDKTTYVSPTTSDNYATAVRPSGINYSEICDLTGANLSVTGHQIVTCYIPENAAGHSTQTINSMADRGNSNAATNAVKINITFSQLSVSPSSTEVSLYLGNPAELKDFNALGNYFYRISAAIKGTNTKDKRIEITTGSLGINYSGAWESNNWTEDNVGA